MFSFCCPSRLTFHPNKDFQVAVVAKPIIRSIPKRPRWTLSGSQHGQRSSGRGKKYPSPMHLLGVFYHFYLQKWGLPPRLRKAFFVGLEITVRKSFHPWHWCNFQELIGLGAEAGHVLQPGGLGWRFTHEDKEDSASWSLQIILGSYLIYLEINWYVWRIQCQTLKLVMLWCHPPVPSSPSAGR